MIGKLKKGSSFGGCIRYVTGKEEAEILASDGVLLGTNTEMAQSFELQRQLNPRIKKPVGHIALSFKPEDKPRLTDDFMAKIALEYIHADDGHHQYPIHHRKASQYGQSTLSYRVQPHQ